jgi:5-methylcytosine-specific restriction endonuclease McrA
MLPPRIPKKPKRASRWRSQAHASFVRKHSCCNCGSDAGIEFAHVRQGSGAGLGQKPDDWNAVSLCRDCHREQHRTSEPGFWQLYYARTGRSVTDLIAAFIKASPKRREIEEAMKERGL